MLSQGMPVPPLLDEELVVEPPLLDPEEELLPEEELDEELEAVLEEQQTRVCPEGVCPVH